MFDCKGNKREKINKKLVLDRGPAFLIGNFRKQNALKYAKITIDAS